MNVTSRLLVLSASAVLLSTSAVMLAAGAAKAEEQPMRQLLAHGYTIVGTAIVPSDFSQRAMGSEGWKDELLITLQRGDSVAFCHTLFAATVDNDAVLDVSCFVPAGLPPAASSEAQQSSEAPPPDPP